MPSARIHEAIAKEVNKNIGFDELLLRIGTVAPDSWRNVEAKSGIKDKYLTHFWDFRVKNGQANDYIEFYMKYYNYLSNPFYFGYLIHLIVDQYWKTYIDPKYEMVKDGIKGFKLKNGEFHSDNNWWGYFDSLKMQRKIAKIYELGELPINQNDLANFTCCIDELNLSGLFGPNGTLNYLNKEIMANDEESEIYDIDEVISDIHKTKEHVEKELAKLALLQENNINKIKIAVDIDDTILCTKELEKLYWEKFLLDNPEVDADKEYKCGDMELSIFWSQYREKMAFGEVKPYASAALNELIKQSYVIDLLSARPLDKYTSLKQKLVKYFELKGINYRYINLGFYSKKEFLKEHGYDILIDNDMKYILEAESVGVIPILYGNNPDYKGYQTDNWSQIPKLIGEILEKRFNHEKNYCGIVSNNVK